MNSRLRLNVENYYENRGDICLCLSGGGFRAAAYHLGVVRWLNAVGMLRHVAEVRAVSGGALLAGLLARNAPGLFGETATQSVFDTTVSVPLRRFLAGDVRTGAILRTLHVNSFYKKPRVSLIQSKIEALVGTDPTPSRGPRFALTAFDVGTKMLVDLDPSQRHDGPLATQIAASAAFPPIFGPVGIGERSLIDGGVASNLGLSGRTLHSWRCVIVSDASRPAPAWLDVKGVPMFVRMLPYLRDGANRVMRDFIASADSDRCLAIVVPLNVEDWYPREHAEALPDMSGLARLRTDLAGFSRADIQRLEAAGEAMADSIVGDAFDRWLARIDESGLRPNEACRQSLSEQRWSSQ